MGAKVELCNLRASGRSWPASGHDRRTDDAGCSGQQIVASPQLRHITGDVARSGNRSVRGAFLLTGKGIGVSLAMMCGRKGSSHLETR